MESRGAAASLSPAAVPMKRVGEARPPGIGADDEQRGDESGGGRRAAP